MGTDCLSRGRWSRCLVAALPVLLGSCGSQTNQEAGSGEESVTVNLPPATPLENEAALQQDAPPPPAAEAEVEPSASADNATAELEQADELVAVSNATEEDQSATEASPPAESNPPASATARLPLPNSVVAQTIERIGYRCGRVVSATAAPGAAPGVYQVTCSSGLSFQASQVNGRYRFRQLRN